MDVHPTPFPANKPQPVKSKYKKTSEAPKSKIKEAPTQKQHRRTFGTIRNPNVPAKTLPEKPKAKASNPVSVKQSKTEAEIGQVPKTESAKKTLQNGSDEKAKLRKKKKSVSFPEKLEESVTKKSPVGGEAKTPVRPPFSVKPIRIPGTPYLSAEKCSSCRFDRLETASYWLAQIKSAEFVGKHFVAAAFFRLANDCKAEPTRTLEVELKKYVTRYDHLSTKTEWKEVSRMYGILKEDRETKSNEHRRRSLLITKEKATQGSVGDDQEQRIEDDDDIVKEILVQET